MAAKVCGDAIGASHQGQLSGKWILLFFCGIQFLTYFDRGVMAGLLSYAEQYYGLNGKLAGTLGSGYFVSIMIVAPIVAAWLVGFSGRVQMLSIVVGSLVWGLAVFLCRMAESYSVLLLGRVLTGVGEAFYCVLASPIIDDAAPPGGKSMYLGIFYSLVFVATGVGFVAPGFYSDPAASEKENWQSGRMLFVLEAILMVPLVAAGVRFADRFHKPQPGKMPSDQCEVTSYERSISEASSWRQTLEVLLEPRFFLLFIGYSASMFTLNGFNFWCPTFLNDRYDMDKKSAGILLGALVVVTGLAGTGIGGIAMDKVTGPEASDAERCRASCFIAGLSAGLALPFGCAAMLMDTKEGVLSLMGVYLFISTIPTAPVVVGMMQAVHPHRRGIAMGLASFGAHLLGDVISPILVGSLKDRTNSLTSGMWLLVLWGTWSLLAWTAAGFVGKNARPVVATVSQDAAHALIDTPGTSPNLNLRS